MKREDIYNGVTEIRDDLIEKAERGLKRRRRWAVPAVAAMLAVAVGLTALWPGLRSGPDGPGTPDDPGVTDGPGVDPTLTPSQGVKPTPGTHPTPTPSHSVRPAPNVPFALALAAYPEQAHYDENSPDLWFKGAKARREAAERYAGGADHFFTAAAAQFLSGAQGENRVCSPLNLYMALAMTAEITGGNSRAQILKLLGAGDLAELREQVSALWLGTYQDDGAAAAVMANSLWLNRDVSYIQETVDALAEHHYASAFRGEMGSDAYNAALQNWLNEQTGGLLAEQAGQVELDPSTVLALASTVYFRGRWQDTFRPENTSLGTFHAPGGDVECGFMHMRNAAVCYRGEGFTAVCRRFAGSGSMWFILPDEGTDAEALLADGGELELLNTGRLAEDAQLMWVNESIPKFDVVSDLDLKKGLKALGVTDIFDPAQSDFSPLTNQTDAVAVSQASHAARVTIDEEGCTAAAFTAMAYGTGGPQDEIDFVLDRPFLFAVTGAADRPLFVGIVNQP